ncbi:MAG: tRNA1(Val) (adenine(37)-N6)-methyltransferase [Candidatus Saccharimonadaceae bacterium]
MSNFFFKFKQFTVFQDQCAMKVGTDGVLLGAWTKVNESNRILDIGTGTGLIALMLAQRNTNAQIKAIDIDEDCVVQAQQNVASSVFANRIQVEQKSFQEYVNESGVKYDLIVSNPPFFQNSLKSPNSFRNFARHDTTLSFSEIIIKSSLLLSNNGRLALVLPFDLKHQVIDEAFKADLATHRITNVFPLPYKPAKRFLIEFGLEEKECVEDNLIIELSRHQYTNEFITITMEFYLDR